MDFDGPGMEWMFQGRGIIVKVVFFGSKPLPVTDPRRDRLKAALAATNTLGVETTVVGALGQAFRVLEVRPPVLSDITDPTMEVLVESIER